MRPRLPKQPNPQITRGVVSLSTPMDTQGRCILATPPAGSVTPLAAKAPTPTPSPHSWPVFPRSIRTPKKGPHPYRGAPHHTYAKRDTRHRRSRSPRARPGAPLLAQSRTRRRARETQRTFRESPRSVHDPYSSQVRWIANPAIWSLKYTRCVDPSGLSARALWSIWNPRASNQRSAAGMSLT
jgi:hypothetical protein